MIFLALPFVAALMFAAVVFVVATRKPFVSPRERRLRLLLTVLPVMLIGYLLIGRPPRRK